MKLRKRIIAGGVMTLSLLAMNVSAKVTEAEAAKLGAELTPIGTEKAGNAAGTIPEWTGGLTSEGAGVENGNPFPDDKILFTIDKSNMDQYKDNLSPGQIAMMTKYTDYKMPVYQSRRTSGYPQKVYDGAKNNATTVEMIDGGNGLSQFELSVPFAIPKNGLEVIWNHITRYRGGSVRRVIGQATPLANGNYSMVQFLDEITWRSSLTDYDPNVDPNVMFYFKQIIQSPARLAGNVLMVHETIDQVKEPRRAWVYNAGQRRVRRAPQVAYDGPGTASDGLRTSDNFDMYNGSPDRYTWNLVGKKEVYIPYNSYNLDSKALKYDDIIKTGHINQDHARYELHRVWVVEATLKEGQRHIYAKRTFYIDEDTWQATVIDHYDGRGELWRVAEAHNLMFYKEQVPWYTIEALYDMLSGRYLVNGLNNEQDTSYEFGFEKSSKYYTPGALRRAGKR